MVKYWEIIIKPEQLEKCKNVAEIKNWNLDDRTLHLPLNHMEISNEVAKIIGNLRNKVIGSNQQLKLFKGKAQSLLILFWRSSLKEPPNIGYAEMQ